MSNPGNMDKVVAMNPCMGDMICLSPGRVKAKSFPHVYMLL